VSFELDSLKKEMNVKESTIQRLTREREELEAKVDDLRSAIEEEEKIKKNFEESRFFVSFYPSTISNEFTLKLELT